MLKMKMAVLRAQKLKMSKHFELNMQSFILN